MFKKITSVVAFILLTSFAFAQNLQISGIVKDTATKASVKNAVITLLSPKDSILKAFTRVKEDGSYLIKDVKPGKYIFSVSHPTFGEYVDDIDFTGANTKIPLVSLTPKSKLLEAVIIKSGSPIKIKGDTTVYTADSFKVSANANVEELLKKLPGIQVDKNGQIKAMGQTVEKVLVDGEEFFGDDPGMAVKNLRADAVKEVQVFDKKSDQAEFTGIDDGKTKKTINLKLKENKKKGYFGKIDLAGGLLKNKDPRYNDNLLISSFKGKRKLSAFLLNGNTGQDGLNWQDEQKYGGNDNDNNGMFDEDGGVNFSFGAQSTQDEEPNIDAQNGFLTNVNAGLQYSNKWNEKTSLNFAPKYNSQRYDNTKTSYTQNQLKDRVLNTNSNDTLFINRYNVKLKATYEVKLDTSNTIKITAKSNFYHTESTDVSDGTTLGGKNEFVNSFEKSLSTNSDKQAFGLNVSLKHKFKKARRTFSLTGDWNQLNNDGTNLLRSENIFLDTLGFPVKINLNQEKNYTKVTNTSSTRIVYTEPLSKKLALELAYQLSINNGTNDQTTLNYNTATNKYDTRVDTLSNEFVQKIVQNIPSFKVNYSYKKFKANIGAGVSFINFNFDNLSLKTSSNRDFTNFTPSANLTYTRKANHSFSIKYTGTTKQPTIDQLQPLRNNNDLFNQYIGNPDLKPSFTNSFSINNFGYNFVKDLWQYQSIILGLENNSIANNRVTDATGATKIQPINTNGNINLNLLAGIGFKQKKINTRFSFNFNSGFNRYIDFVNNAKNISDNTNVGLNVNINKTKDKKYDISLYFGPNFNSQKTTQTSFKNKYLSTNLGMNSTIYYKKVWSLNVEYNLDSRQKTAQAPSLTYNIVNTKIQRTFKKDEYTLYFTARDLLNQNIGLDRNFFGTTFTEIRNTRLQRYFMLGFAWNFKNKVATKK